tara:strand:- start:111 stop:227 length:117 start_codon:yes stop_codon:yes gene_type:complete
LNKEEFKNFEDHLEGIIILNNKVGLLMEDKKIKINSEE